MLSSQTDMEEEFDLDVMEIVPSISAAFSWKTDLFWESLYIGMKIDYTHNFLRIVIVVGGVSRWFYF